MTEHSKYYDDPDRNKPIECHGNGQGLVFCADLPADTPKQGAAHALALKSGFACEYDAGPGVHHYHGEIEQIERLLAAKVSARAADAPSEPSEKKAAAWIDQFGNVFPLGAYQPSGKPSYLDADKRGWKPLFRAADALDSQPTEPTKDAK